MTLLVTIGITALIMAVSWPLVLMSSTASVYGFSMSEVYRGFAATKKSTVWYVTVPFNVRRFWDLPNPIAIFWYCGTEEQYIALCQRMVEQKVLFNPRELRESWTEEDEHLAVRAKLYDNCEVWPSKEIAEFMNSENPWYPNMTDDGRKPSLRLV